MIVCDLCGSRNIRQEASIMLNPNEKNLRSEFVLEDFFWMDYYFCESCGEECLPIPDPHHKEKKDV